MFLSVFSLKYDLGSVQGTVKQFKSISVFTDVAMNARYSLVTIWDDNITKFIAASENENAPVFQIV